MYLVNTLIFGFEGTNTEKVAQLLSDVADIKISNINQDSFIACTRGVGGINLAGEVHHLTLHTLGAGDIDAKDLRANVLFASIHSSGNITSTCVFEPRMMLDPISLVDGTLLEVSPGCSTTMLDSTISDFGYLSMESPPQPICACSDWATM